MLRGTEDVAAIEGVGAEPQNIEGFLTQDAAKAKGLESKRLADLANQEFIKNTTAQASDGIFKNYLNVLKSGDMGAIGNATMDMGGEALKAVFTNPHPTIEGKTVLDKTAMLSALVAVPSYLEAKALADEAGLTDEEFNEDLYNSEKAVYMSKYQENLPYENFGITAAKNGGRIGFAFGSPKDKTMFEELNVDTIYRPDNKPSVLEETLEDDKMVSLNSSRLTQLMLALEEAEAKKDMDMIMQIKFDIDKEMKKYAKGGRVNRMFGSPEEGEGITTIDVDMEMEEEPKSNMMMAYEPGGFTSAQKTYMYRRLTAMGGSDRSITVPDLYKVFKNPGKYPADEAVIKAILDANNKKDGGRIEMKLDKVEKKEKGGIMGMEVPVRKNQGGVSELDYRNTGGFVPVGVKERADDVPAMLSKNEFVFTADAVRNAGDGNINKGAQKMYNMMKNLENGGTLA